MTIPTGKHVLASTGLVIAAPRGHMILVAPRSSTWKKWGVKLANTVGIVDEDYCGDEDILYLNLLNPGEHTAFIPAGTRIAQGVFVPVTRAQFCETEEMGESRGGWGSTGS